MWPEIVFGKALSDYFAVRSHLGALRGWAKEDGVEWSLAHSCFADMGGFLIDFRGCGDGEEQSSDDDCAELDALDEQASPDEASHKKVSIALEIAELDFGASVKTAPNEPLLGRDVETGDEAAAPEPFWPFQRLSTLSPYFQQIEALVRDLEYRLGDTDWEIDTLNQRRLQAALDSSPEVDRDAEKRVDFINGCSSLVGNYWVLDSYQLKLARRMGIIGALPCISEDELKDKGKGDGLLKLLTILQGTWLTIDLVIHVHRRLSTTPLEMITFSFVALSLCTYICHAGKLHNVVTANYIPATRHASVSELRDLVAAAPKPVFGVGNPGVYMAGHLLHQPQLQPQPQPPPGKKESSLSTFSIGCITAALLIGVTHLLAFLTLPPDPQWETPDVPIIATSLAKMAFYPFLVALRWAIFRFGLFPRPTRVGGKEVLRLPEAFVVSFGTMYAVVLRVYLMGLAVISTAAVGEGAFGGTWAEGIPRVG
ncbi:hypothetical protein K402DRAFT_457721 [Aulographum hederae CBS 113979]|uniref:Uncharacterized protein n=1 Tax=Aulographum hederae CBS 113979 TaxID=1176131 RepID=A0A6G1GLZ4_9PEZI|nr:hypothetical protein K402DRAFT_457721 [Aulographum hederae CBS 113979]